MSLIRSRSAQLELTGYAWLQSEVSLEESNCAGLLGDLGTTQAAVAKGISLAKNHNYRTLYLRGLGFEADAEASLGDATKDFSLATEGLHIFWSTPVEVMEGYNFYTDLDTAADNLRLPRLQVALWRQATALIDSHPDLLQRAMAHRWYGNSAYLAGMSALAGEEFAKASALSPLRPKLRPQRATTWTQRFGSPESRLGRVIWHEPQLDSSGCSQFSTAYRALRLRLAFTAHRPKSTCAVVISPAPIRPFALPFSLRNGP